MLAPCNFKDSGNLSKQGKPQPMGKNMLLLAWTSSLVYSAEGAWLLFNYLNLISFHWTCFRIMNLNLNLNLNSLRLLCVSVEWYSTSLSACRTHYRASAQKLVKLSGSGAFGVLFQQITRCGVFKPYVRLHCIESMYFSLLWAAQFPSMVLSWAS